MTPEPLELNLLKDGYLTLQKGDTWKLASDEPDNLFRSPSDGSSKVFDRKKIKFMSKAPWRYPEGQDVKRTNSEQV